jgi:hypothetical protein
MRYSQTLRSFPRFAFRSGSKARQSPETWRTAPIVGQARGLPHDLFDRSLAVIEERGLNWTPAALTILIAISSSPWNLLALRINLSTF